MPSIGCAPCTRAIAVGEDFRSGRWWWESESAKECGLHVSHADDTPDDVSLLNRPSGNGNASPLSSSFSPLQRPVENQA